MTDLSTRIPPGDDVPQRPVEKPAFGEDLLERILDSGNLRRTWNRVRANKGAAGVDGMSIDEFLDWAKKRDTGNALLANWKQVTTHCLLSDGLRSTSPMAASARWVFRA